MEQEIKRLRERIEYLERRVQELENSRTVYGPFYPNQPAPAAPPPNWKPSYPTWKPETPNTNPSWILPDVICEVKRVDNKE